MSKYKYGSLMPEQYAELAHKQGGRCAVCDGTPGDRGLNVDYEQESDKVRGLLCDTCDIIINAAKNNHNKTTKELLHCFLDYITVVE